MNRRLCLHIRHEQAGNRRQDNYTLLMFVWICKQSLFCFAIFHQYAAQRVQAKTVVFFNNQKYEFLCRPTIFWELSKKNRLQNPNIYPYTYRRCCWKLIVLFTKWKNEFLCKPTKIITISKFRVVKTPISLPIHIGRYFSASWKLNIAAAVTLLSMAGWWAVPANSKLFWIAQIQISDESRERIPALSHSPSVIKPSQAMGVHEIALQAIGCCEKEHPYSQIRLTRLTAHGNGVSSGWKL